MELDGKVALVTGAEPRCRRRDRPRSRAGGLPGRLRGAVDGGGSAAHARDLDETVARIAAEGGEAIAVPTNLADEGEVVAMVAATVARFGRLDVLVNNAAITFVGDLGIRGEAARPDHGGQSHAPLRRHARGGTASPHERPAGRS